MCDTVVHPRADHMVRALLFAARGVGPRVLAEPAGSCARSAVDDGSRWRSDTRAARNERKGGRTLIAVASQ